MYLHHMLAQRSGSVVNTARMFAAVFPRETLNFLLCYVTRGQSNLTKSASRGTHSPVRGHPRGSKFVPLNSWGRGSY